MRPQGQVLILHTLTATGVTPCGQLNQAGDKETADCLDIPMETSHVTAWCPWDRFCGLGSWKSVRHIYGIATLSAKREKSRSDLV